MPSFLQFPLFKNLFRSKRAARKRPRRNTAAPHTSDTDLKVIWDNLIDHYFPDGQQLKKYTVRWSTRRQKRTLGSCSITKHTVRIARELMHAQFSEWVEPILYHELCHAYLGKNIQRENGKRAWHGKEFRALERRHPATLPLNAWIKSGGWGKAVRVDRASNRRQI